MSISAANISNALHGLSHHGSTHPHAQVDRGQQFGQQLAAAARYPVQSAATSAAQQETGGKGPGELLSTDMLQAVQAIR